MTDVTVFVVRYCGSNPLLGARLKLIADCAKTALHKIRYPDDDPEHLSSPHPTGDSNPSSSLERLAVTSQCQTNDHNYDRSSPHKSTGRGGLYSSVMRRMQPVPNSKKPRFDFASTMAYYTD